LVAVGLRPAYVEGYDTKTSAAHKHFERSDMSENAIELRGLEKTYAATKKMSAKKALDGINLDIPRGSIFGLLGPNGAGKSTLINILAGLVQKSSGTVNVWGFDQDKNPRQSRAAIGVMPQELNLDPFFTPGASLDMQAGLYGVPKRQRKTSEILRLIGLEDKANAYARSLSGGMRRRLLLGKALVHSPQILVLDEPTAGVDIGLRQMLWDNIRQLNADGMTVILTTHYLEEAQEMCDRIAIIHEGKLRALDTTANLLSKLDTKTVVVQAQVSQKISLPDGVTLDHRPDGSLAFSYRHSTTSPNLILDALRSANAHIEDIQTEQPNLQDVFLEITK
jgi:ABC-2 type transport system ATP-binding protein